MTMQHSLGYLKAKAQIINLKNGTVQIVTPEPIDHETATQIFRQGLHELVNTEYQHNHDQGITEEELEVLHNLIEGVLPPEDFDVI
jgi:hypothetical protein